MGDNSSNPNASCMCFSNDISGLCLDSLARLDGIANFMVEDEDNVVFRRFDRLQLLHLLSLQHQLSTCDGYLQECNLQNQDRFKKALAKIGSLIKEYDEALCIYDRMQNRLKIPRYVKECLRSKAKDDGRVDYMQIELSEEDEAWEELMCIASSADKGTIHKFIDKHNTLKKLFRREPKTREKTADVEKNLKPPNSRPEPPDYYYYSEGAVRFVESLIFSALACGLIMVPITILPYIDVGMFRLFLVLGFVVFAFLVTLMMSRQSQQGNLKTVIAYAALLTAFIYQQQN